MQYVREAVKPYALNVLNRDICACNSCGCKCGTRTMITGDVDAPLMCIMDYPTEEQAGLGRPIHIFDGNGDVKKFLEHCLAPHKVNLDRILFMNTVSCCPTRTVNTEAGTEEVCRTPLPQEIKACSTFVKYAIDAVRPPMLLVLGNVASNVVLPMSISKARGRWISYHGIYTMISYSPAQILDARADGRQERWIRMSREFQTDMDNAMKFYRREWPDSILFD